MFRFYRSYGDKSIEREINSKCKETLMSRIIFQNSISHVTVTPADNACRADKCFNVGEQAADSQCLA